MTTDSLTGSDDGFFKDSDFIVYNLIVQYIKTTMVPEFTY